MPSTRRYVVAQSLHGLIFAELFGKPYTWVNVHEGGASTFKFDDWFSTTEEPFTRPIVFGPDVESLFRSVGSGFIDAMRAVIDYNQDISFGTVTRLPDDPGEMMPVKLSAERGTGELPRWDASHKNRGFTMFRGSRYFGWDRPGVLMPA